MFECKFLFFIETMYIPAYYLRKPWCLILEHAYQGVAYRANDFGKGFDFDSDAIRKITFSDEHFSVEEKIFIDEKELTFSPEYYVIKKRAISNICLQIQKHWHKEADKRKLANPQFIDLYNKAFKKDDPIRSGLQDKVNKYFLDIKKSISSTDTIALDLSLFICEVAKYVAKDEIEKNEIKEIIKVIKTPDEKITPENLLTKYGQLWQTTSANKLPQKFYNSHWRVYERTDARLRKEATWGIASQYLHIGKIDKNGCIPAKILAMGSEYNGVVSFNPQIGFLLGHLIREIRTDDNSTTPIFLAIQLNEHSDQTLMIGHAMYYSLPYSKFMTKTFLFENKDNPFPPEEAFDSDDNFTDIELSIRQFLSSRSKNRLTMPATNISNLNPLDPIRSLQSWIKNKVTRIANDDILPALLSKYYICYFDGEVEKVKYTDSDKEDDKNKKDEDLANSIRIDELDIRYDVNSADFYASYIRNPTVNKKESDSGAVTGALKGKVRRKQLTVEVILEEETLPNSKIGFAEDLSPTAHFALINFSVNEIGFKNSDAVIFPGIISGLTDSNSTPASFRCIAIKKQSGIKKDGETPKELILNIKDKKNAISKNILNYFRAHLDESQIKVAPILNATPFENFKNITMLYNNGGRIEIVPLMENGGFVFCALCFLKSDTTIEDVKFKNSSINEAISDADHWLSGNRE